MKQNRVKYILAATLLLPLFLFLQYAFAKEPQKKVAYITFDDGPTLNTPDILKTLDKYGAKATFFVLEERIIQYPDFIKQIYYSKNALGLHGVSHSEAIYDTPTSPFKEMEKTNKALYNLLGEDIRLVRVPYGSGYRLTKRQAEILEENEYILWDWNVDPRDSVGKIIPQKIMSNLRRDLKKCKGSPVILLHDRKSTARLLPDLLEILGTEGYAMHPLDEDLVPLNFVKKEK